MLLPDSIQEYEKEIKESRTLLTRLAKGERMLEQAVKDKDIIKALKLIRQWHSIAKELFTHQEITTLIHQQILRTNSVSVMMNGQLIDREELFKGESVELDPWTLLSLEKLKVIFGDDVHNFIELQNDIPQ